MIPFFSVRVVKQCSYERVAVFRHGELTKRVVTLQTYYQRALACKDYKTARLSFHLERRGQYLLVPPAGFHRGHRGRYR